MKLDLSKFSMFEFFLAPVFCLFSLYLLNLEFVSICLRAETNTILFVTILFGFVFKGVFVIYPMDKEVVNGEVLYLIFPGRKAKNVYVLLKLMFDFQGAFLLMFCAYILFT